MPEEALQMLRDLLKDTAPGSLVWVVGGGTVTKLLVDAVKHFRPGLQGNILQTIVAIASIIATALQAQTAGVFADGVVTGVEWRAMGIVAVLIYSTAIAVDQTVKNKNAPSEAELAERMARVRGEAQ